MSLDREELEQMPEGTDFFSMSDQVPTEEELYDLAELFKVFGDSTRIKILYVLVESDMSVGDIAQALNDPKLDFPSAAGAQAEPSGTVPPGRQKYCLFPCG